MTAEEITATQPGEIFAHRNIVNLVNHTDFNLLSKLSFAVEYLKVTHVVVCGHYGCGGIKAALSSHQFGIRDEWLRQSKDDYQVNRDTLFALPYSDAQADMLVEMNVLQQLKNLLKAHIIQKAWHKDQRPILHGWAYSIGGGLLKSLCKMEPGASIDEICRFDF